MVIANQIMLVANTGDEKQLRMLMNELVDHALKSKGCHKYELYQFENTREHFMIVEIFKSAKAHKKYLENETVKSVWKKAEPLIVSRNISALKLTQCLSTQRYWS